MWRRLVALVAALSLAGFAFTGCEKKSGEKDKEKQKKEQEQKKKEEKESADEKESEESVDRGAAKQGEDIQESMEEAANE